MIGTKLGPYEITARLGEGGMGEVYRATDSNLRRDVAIKVLPPAFIADKERLARFEREAQLLAQLNHSNIAQIYGVESSGESRALVMELVDGPTLAERLAAEPLALAESLSIALAIAQALEEAHEKGIVHRDLKPQNVKAPVDGKVKVLDFGLAKAMDGGASASAAGDPSRSPTLMNSPTLTAVQGTQLGMILGTAAYMAPEQARGAAVDKRADIWAFGVVLLEMLTGRSLFAGPTVSDTLAGVLKTEIDWKGVPAGTPAAIRQLLRRCLERNPKNRLHDIADARIVIEEVLSGQSGEGEAAVTAAPVATVPGWRRALPWLAAAAGLATAAVVTMSGRESAPAGIVRSDLVPPKEALYFFQGDFGSPVILSPDGTTIVFGTRSRRQESLTARLWSRSLVTGDEREIAGTDGAYAPFYSPDGRSIGFFANGELRTVAVTGGAAFTVAPAPAGRGGAWAADGTIVYSPGFRDGLWKVRAVGGAPAPLTKVDAAKHSSHRWPVLTPAGAAVVYLAVNHAPELDREDGLRFVRMDGGDDHPIVQTHANGQLAAGQLLFTRGTTLFAQPFDSRSGTLAREPVPVAQTLMVDSTTWRAVLAADSRRLVVAGGISQGETRVSAYSGIDQRERQDVTSRGGYSDIAVAPDGKRLVVGRGESVGTARGDLWIIDTERGTETRFTLEPEDEGTPSWSPDGRYIYYGSRGHKDLKDRIFRKPSDGSGAPELVYESSADVDLWPRNLTPDGKNLMVVTGVVPFAVESDIQVLPLDGSRKLRPMLDGAAADLDAFYSPDGTLVAYASLESGRGQVYVAAIGPDGRAATRWQVSVNGGRRPVWTPDGRKLLFLDERANLLAVDVERSGPAVHFGRAAEALFSTTAVQDFNSIAVGPDGRIWMVQFGDEQSEPLRLIENWTEQLPE